MACMHQEKQYDLLQEEDLIQVFEVYHKKVYSYFFYRIKDVLTAEDLTSQVFEKVIKNRTSYDKDKAPIGVWVFAIAKNCLNNYFREQKKHQFAPLETIMEWFSNKETPEEYVLVEERNFKLHQSINRLKDREKNIIALKFGAGLSNKEIAGIIGISETNVGSILYRSMKKLKVEMEKEDAICLRKA